MKILLVTHWYPPSTGGVASHVYELKRQLQSMGHKVKVLTTSPRSSYDGVISLEPYRIDKIRSTLKSFKPEIIHVHHAFTPLSLISIIFSSKSSIPVILTNHSAYFYDYDVALKTLGLAALPIKYILGKVDNVIAVSNIAKKFIDSFLLGKRAKVIPNGVDTRKYTPDGEKITSESLLGDPTILFVGRLVYRKGPWVLLDALKSVVSEYPKAKLLIVGEGPYLLSLLEKTRKLSLRGNVEFLGYVKQSDLPRIYRSADIFVMPSIFGEAFGIVLLEAMASRLPVIASRVGGIQEIIDNCIDGILVPPKSHRAISKSIIDLYSDRKLMNWLAYNARLKAVKKYDWNIIARKICSEYSITLNQKSPLPHISAK